MMFVFMEFDLQKEKIVEPFARANPVLFSFSWHSLPLSINQHAFSLSLHLQKFNN